MQTSRFLANLLLSLVLLVSCGAPDPTSPQPPAMKPAESLEITMSRDQLYDKLLGMLVGTAIGDAMGAPTEMWARSQIQVEYGHVQGLDSMVRAPSGEGIWGYNLPAGSTTDDTRWKALLVDFLCGESGKPMGHRMELDARDFARYLMRRYESDLAALKAQDGYDPEPFEAHMRRMNWLQEWAVVAKPYYERDLDAYSAAVHKFYGGEMVCGGMLFSPTIGAYYPGQPLRAYTESYKLNLFDIGYAKDIGSLTASMVAAAMEEAPSKERVLGVVREVDPQGYFKSRLVGRTAYKLYQQARYLVHEARQATAEEVKDVPIKLALPLDTEADSLYYAQTARAYAALDQQLMRYPFHPAEIHLVNLTALLFADFDFQQALEFVINYGRDNDTTGAVTGSILGAYYGARALPPDMVSTVIEANKALGLDLPEMAERMSTTLLGEAKP